MAIYGQVVTIARIATVDDMKDLDGRKAEQKERDAIKAGEYVVILDQGKERLYHRHDFSKADDGAAEITRAIDALRRRP